MILNGKLTLQSESSEAEKTKKTEAHSSVCRKNSPEKGKARDSKRTALMEMVD